MPKVSQEVILLFGKLMLFVVSAFNIFLFFLFVCCVSPLPFSVTSLYSRFFVCYFCPAQGMHNLVCFQTAHNFMLFPLVKLSCKYPCVFSTPCEKLLQTTAILPHCLAKLSFVPSSSKKMSKLLLQGSRCCFVAGR